MLCKFPAVSTCLDGDEAKRISNHHPRSRALALVLVDNGVTGLSLPISAISLG